MQCSLHCATSAAFFIHIVLKYYSDIIMSAMASQITGVSIVCSIVCSDADQRKHQSSTSLAFVMGILQWPMDSPHKKPVAQKMFLFVDVIMKMITKIGVVFWVVVSQYRIICSKRILYSNLTKSRLPITYYTVFIITVVLSANFQNDFAIGCPGQDFVRFEFKISFGRISYTATALTHCWFRSSLTAFWRHVVIKNYDLLKVRLSKTSLCAIFIGGTNSIVQEL